EASGGPANLRLLNDKQLVRLLQSLIPKQIRPSALAVGMAGARTEADRQRIRRAASQVWSGIPCHATNDLETALMAAEARRSGNRRLRSAEARVLVLSGTGSCCFGRRSDGATVKVG